MAKSPRNEDPRVERDDSQGSGTYVEVVATPRRRKRGANSSAPNEPAHGEGGSTREVGKRPPAKRESVRPEVPVEQIRLPSGAVAYVSPALPRSSRVHEEPQAERSKAADLHLDAPEWIERGPTEPHHAPYVSVANAPRTIREVIPRRIEDEREELERVSHVPSEARSSRVESVRPESTRPRATVEAERQSSIPSESTRPRAVIDCIPDETTQARARLSAVQASLVLASKSDRPPALSGSTPPPASGASVLDAKPQMVSDPPEPRRTSWALVGTVAVLCSIISAAGVVAFKEYQGSSASMDRPMETTPRTTEASRTMAREAARSAAQADVARSASAPVVSPLPTAGPLPAPLAPSTALAPTGEAAPSAEAASAAGLGLSPSPSSALQPAPALSAPLSPAPTASAASLAGARKFAPRAPAAAGTTQDPTTEAEVVPLPNSLTPADTKAVLDRLAEQERATAAAEEQKREEERKLPSTARLKAPSVRIEAARIAAALKKASQEAVARVNQEQEQAQAPAAPAPATPAETEPASTDALPENPF